jgi:hypothetical protein
MCRVVVQPRGFETVDYLVELDAINEHPEFHAARITAGVQACIARGLLTTNVEKRMAYYDDPKV